MKKPVISLLAIGDELVSGKISDKNGPWLSQFLVSKGLELTTTHFVRDNKTAFTQVFSHLWQASDIVIITGGLGPTKDDLTKFMVADFFQFPLEENEELHRYVANRYLEYQKTYDQAVHHYHLFPKNMEWIKNSNGLAPGIFYRHNNKLLCCAPGVPREFFVMFEEQFFGKFQCSNKTNLIREIIVRTQGIPEEKIFFELCPQLWSDLEKIGQVSSLPHIGGVDISVKFSADDDEFNTIYKNIRSLFKSLPIYENIWQWGNLPLNEYVVQKAKEKKLTFGFAESCTGGLISSLITDVSGSSDVFFGSIISYDNSIKKSILEVDKETLNRFGAVSEEVAKEMAIGAKEKLKVDIVIAVSGIAGPGGATETKPVGTVKFGIASINHVHTQAQLFRGDRLVLKERFAIKALHYLLKEIERV